MYEYEKKRGCLNGCELILLCRNMLVNGTTTSLKLLLFFKRDSLNRKYSRPNLLPHTSLPLCSPQSLQTILMPKDLSLSVCLKKVML